MTEKFVPRSILTSPFGRKVRMAIDMLGLRHRLTVVPANTLDENNALRKQNPLGKIPCLLRADGSANRRLRRDHRILAGRRRHRPATAGEWPGPLQGADAGAACRRHHQVGDPHHLRESVRDPDKHSERWLNRQRGKITRALAAFEAAPPDPNKTHIVSIGL